MPYMHITVVSIIIIASFFLGYLLGHHHSEEQHHIRLMGLRRQVSCLKDTIRSLHVLLDRTL